MSSDSSVPPVLWYSWAFGSENYHKEAICLMLSALSHRSPRSRFRLYTDKPAWYGWLEPLAEVVEVTDAQCKAWSGARGLSGIHLKLNLIETVASQFQGHTVWLDTDMWTLCHLANLEALLDRGAPLMHRLEHPICGGPRQTREYLAYFRDVYPGRVDAMNEWNMGVVGLPMGMAGLAGEAMVILDGMTKSGITHVTRDQMALSAVLEKTGRLSAAEAYFRHYFGKTKRKIWEPFQSYVLFRIAVDRQDPEAILEWIRALPSDAVPPRKFSWLSRKKISIGKRLGLFDRLW